MIYALRLVPVPTNTWKAPPTRSLPVGSVLLSRPGSCIDGDWSKRCEVDHFSNRA